MKLLSYWKRPISSTRRCWASCSVTRMTPSAGSATWPLTLVGWLSSPITTPLLRASSALPRWATKKISSYYHFFGHTVQFWTCSMVVPWYSLKYYATWIWKLFSRWEKATVVVDLVEKSDTKSIDPKKQGVGTDWGGRQHPSSRHYSGSEYSQLPHSHPDRSCGSRAAGSRLHPACGTGGSGHVQADGQVRHFPISHIMKHVRIVHTHQHSFHRDSSSHSLITLIRGSQPGTRGATIGWLT